MRGNILTKLVVSQNAPAFNDKGRVIAPNFCLTDLEGSAFCLNDFRGKVIVLDFMATWCLGCEDQDIQLKQVQKQLGDKGVVLISIDVDPGESVDEVKAFRDYLGTGWRFAIDTPENRVGLQYESKYLPTLYIIDKNGFIVWSERGVTESSKLIQLLNQYR